MPNSVENFLRFHGPCLSSAICEQLTQNGLSPDAARQKVFRAKGEVAKLEGINFPNREKFLFIRDQFGKHGFREALALALEKTGTAAGRALIGLSTRGDAILADRFAVASGLPILRAKGHLLHATVEEQLVKFSLIKIVDSPEGKQICHSDVSDLSARRRAVSTVEDILLSELKLWLIKVGWSSTNTLKTRLEGQQEFGQFAWDIVGPCFLNAFRMHSLKKGDHGFLVGDIVLDRTLTTRDLRPFFSKWDALRAQRRKQRFQPMIIADSFQKEALNELRAKGTLICQPSVFLGQNTADDLRALVITLTNAAAAVVNNPSAVFEMIARLAKLEGAAANLRGVAMELMVGRLYMLKGYQFDIRHRIRDSEGNLAEIDVKARNPKETVCCECKAKNAKNLVGVSEIDDWVRRSLPRIKSYLRDLSSPPSVQRFEFYTSTDYTDEAKELIDYVQSTHSKTSISFLNGTQLLQELKEFHEQALVEIFQEQFVKH